MPDETAATLIWPGVAVLFVHSLFLKNGNEISVLAAMLVWLGVAVLFLHSLFPMINEISAHLFAVLMFLWMILLLLAVISKIIMFIVASRLFAAMGELYFRLIFEVAGIFCAIWGGVGIAFIFLIVIALLILPVVPVAMWMVRIGITF